MIRLLFLFIITTSSLALWTESPNACQATIGPTGALAACALEPFNGCNGTLVTVRASGTCGGGFEFYLDTHGRNDLRFLPASANSAGSCEAKAFLMESLIPLTLSELSVGAWCARAPCSGRTLIVSVSNVASCVALYVPDVDPCVGQNSEPLNVPFPDATVCPGSTLTLSGVRGAWDVLSHDVAASAVAVAHTPDGVVLEFGPSAPLPSPNGLLVIATCAGATVPTAQFGGATCEPVDYTGWCALLAAGVGTACFQPGSWVAGTTLRLSPGATVQYGSASYGPGGSWAVPQLLAGVTCASGCSGAWALLSVPNVVPPPAPPVPPSPPLQPASCDGQMVTSDASNATFVVFSGQIACLTVCSADPYSLVLSIIGPGGSLIPLDSSQTAGSGCASFKITPPGGTIQLVLQPTPSAANLTYSFGLGTGAQTLAVARCLSGPCAYSPEIAGGTDAPYVSFVASLRNSRGVHFCGATLIAPTLLLTAAHCALAALAGGSALVGAVDLQNPFLGSQHSIVGAAWSASFSDSDPSRANDVGIVLLGDAALQDPAALETSATDLASFEQQHVGNYAVVALGWGQNGTGILQDKLQLGVLPLAKTSACAAALGTVPAADALCAGDASGRVQTCPGDSGGPLLLLGGLDMSSSGVLQASTQLGIVSWGGACQESVPYGVFVSLQAHGSWLQAASTRALSENPVGGCDSAAVCFEAIAAVPPAPNQPASVQHGDTPSPTGSQPSSADGNAGAIAGGVVGGVVVLGAAGFLLWRRQQRVHPLKPQKGPLSL